MSKGFLRIGELAARAGVGIQTVRYYERRGLIPRLPRLTSGHRAYPPTLVNWIRFIKAAQTVGFSLRDIAELKLLAKATASRQRADVRRRLDARIADIDARMEQMRAVRHLLISLSDETLTDPMAVVGQIEERLRRIGDKTGARR